MRPRSLLLLVPLASIAACGGASDEDQITDIIKAGGKDPATICDHLTTGGLDALGGKAKCVQLAKQQGSKDRNVDIKSLKVDGDKATAEIESKDGKNTVRFVKEDGGWKVSPT
jgi:hypothetical protein